MTVEMYNFTNTDYTGFSIKNTEEVLNIYGQIKNKDKIRKLEDYADAKDTFIEVTMSCTKDEAIRWMIFFMHNSLGYGVMTSGDKWKSMYLAAYDIYSSLTKRK